MSIRILSADLFLTLWAGFLANFPRSLLSKRSFSAGPFLRPFSFVFAICKSRSAHDQMIRFFGIRGSAKEVICRTGKKLLQLGKSQLKMFANRVVQKLQHVTKELRGTYSKISEA